MSGLIGATPQRDFFTAIWSEIKKTWGDEIFAKGNRLTEKVGIICMTRFMVDRLASMADLEDYDLDLSDLEEVKRRVSRDLNRQTIEFWNAKWKGSGYDTAIGHATVMEALTKILRNIRGDKEWMSSIDML